MLAGEVDLGKAVLRDYISAPAGPRRQPMPSKRGRIAPQCPRDMNRCVATRL